MTYDMFTRWRDEHPSMTPQERIVLTRLVSEHMVNALRNDEVRLLNDDGSPVNPEDEETYWLTAHMRNPLDE